jgi:hypothetical protein
MVKEIRNNGKSSALDIDLLQVIGPSCIRSLRIGLLKSGQFRVMVKEIRINGKTFVP